MKPFKLDNENKISTGYVVPDAYFDSFADRVMLKTDQPTAKVVSMYTRNYFVLAAAASIAIFIMVSIYNNYSNTSSDFDPLTLETYLSYQANLNQFDLVNQLDTEDLNSLGSNIDLEHETIEDLLASNPNAISIILE